MTGFSPICLDLRATRLCGLERLNFLYLKEVEFHRSLAAEHVDEDFDLSAVFVDVGNLSFEVFERTIVDLYGVSLCNIEGKLWLTDAHTFLERGDFFFRNRGWGGTRSDKSSDVWGVAHDVPGVVGDDHLDQHVAWEDFFFDRFALAVFDFDLLFFWNKDIEDLFFHVHGLDALVKVIRHVLLVTGVGVDCVPAAAVFCYLFWHILLVTLGGEANEFLESDGQGPIEHGKEESESCTETDHDDRVHKGAPTCWPGDLFKLFFRGFYIGKQGENWVFHSDFKTPCGGMGEYY